MDRIIKNIITLYLVSKWVLAFTLLCFLSSCTRNDIQYSINSPDHLISVTFSVDSQKSISYSVSQSERYIVTSSPIGINVGGLFLGKEVSFGKPSYGQLNEEYLSRGIHSMAHNYCNIISIPVQHESGITYFLECRAYNDGIAFRLIIPGTGSRIVYSEQSGWTIPDRSKVWFFERNSNYKLKSYAGIWTKTDIERFPSVSNQGPIQGKPLIIELPDEEGYLVISEAALHQYSGMRLKAIEKNRFQTNFTEGEKGFVVQDTIVTPWRVTLYASDLNKLVNNDLIANLNDPPSPELYADLNYIKPGKSVWRWWHKNTGSAEEEKKYIDYARQLGFEYSTIDEGWEKWPDKWNTVQSLIDFAQEKEVGVFLWKHSKQLNDTTNNWSQMRLWLDSVKEVGAAGVKVDFMNSEAKVWIDFEIKLLQEAAKRQLMINFHGCHASTGEWRTYPNEITREGIRGLELNRMKEGPITAAHNTALPFTRFVIGHADYTPLGLTAPGPTTWAHQLATMVLFSSPLQVVAEDPLYLLKSDHLEAILPLLDSLPTIWEETIVLKGSNIGELAAFARRSGDNWFIGILNGEKDIGYTLDLSFLEGQVYQGIIVEDDLTADVINLVGFNAKAKLKEYTVAVPFKIKRKRVHANQSLPIQLMNGGGYFAMLTPTDSNNP